MIEYARLSSVAAVSTITLARRLRATHSASTISSGQKTSNCSSADSDQRCCTGEPRFSAHHARWRGA